MRRVPKVLVRLGLPAVAVLGLALAGCGDPATPTPAAPPATPSSTVSPGLAPVADGRADGLTVRYLADDGTVKTVGVEDFPR
ncbi:hypothetical protein [Microlunatus antarcticus]|uniref:Uncharacterized protein n=1 Tax=Microlunatus antarcticus TaxID=53388 RepID=A0A7W5JSF2_9ACTN|nr:hypothetical protein [Microlunatus antarcticus]MBB3325516.1 hypothetical protein [Microlunatus antarcticus]